MADQQNQPNRNPDLSGPRPGGPPATLWLILGIGIGAVLVGGGLLLAVLSASRSVSPREAPAFDSPTYPAYPAGTVTLTPYFTPESAQEPTRTPSPASEAGSDRGPDELLQLTPQSRSGVISISPYLHADAGNFALAPGQLVTLRWEEYPPGALRYYFLLQPQAGGASQTLGTDQDPADGVQVEWTVPENIAGDLYGIAIYQGGQAAGAVFAGAVYAGAADGSSPAVNVLKEFFRTLALGEYKAASDLYGGDYSILAEYNPDLDPANHAGLLERACTVNGFVCLPVLNVGSAEPMGDGVFVVVASFQNPDGSIFTLGPCCGDAEEGNQGQSAFEFQVQKDSSGSWLVLDLPVYQP